MSTADILAMARGKKATEAPPAAEKAPTTAKPVAPRRQSHLLLLLPKLWQHRLRKQRPVRAERYRWHCRILSEDRWQIMPWFAGVELE